MNRTTVIIVAIVVVAAAIALGVYRHNAVQAPTNTSSTYVAPVNDSPDDIDRDLNGIDTGAGMDADFQATDKDIQSL